mgnify:CR=1 FL=1
MNVRELLQSKKEAVITIDAEDTIGAAAHKMSANRIAALVVMKDDAPVGIISERKTSCVPWLTMARRPAAG